MPEISMEVGRANEVDSAKHLYLNRSDQSHANCRTSKLQSFVGREDSRWRGEKKIGGKKGRRGRSELDDSDRDQRQDHHQARGKLPR